MIPVILELGPIKLHSYGLCLAIGMLVGYYLLVLELKRLRQPETFAGTVIVLAAIFGIIGARLFDIFEHPGNFFNDPIRTLFSGSGLTWYGGFILATLAIWIAARRKNIPWWTLVDATTPGLAIGYGFGRLGCLLSGDGCYGQACEAGLPFPLCMSFPKGIVATTEVVYNTPLWEIGGAILTFSYIWAMRKRLRRPAELFLHFVVLHGLLRFSVEFVRRNPSLLGGLSQAQVISIGMVVGGIILLVIRSRMPAPAALPEPAPQSAAASAGGAPATKRPQHQTRPSKRSKKRRK